MKQQFSIFGFPPFTNNFLLYVLVLCCTLWSLPKAAAQCSQWTIEVTQTPALNVSQPTCNTDDEPCGVLYYYVYLTNGSNPTSITPTDFNFLTLNITGDLSVRSPLTQMPGSHLDAARSFLCSPDNINDTANVKAPVMSVEEEDGKFSYMVQDNLGEDTIKWAVTGRRLLFVLAVDAFPGDTVSITNIESSVNWLVGGIPDTCYPFINYGSLDKMLNNPPSSCANLNIRMNDLTLDATAEYPQRRRLSVYITNTGLTNIEIKNLEFLVAVNSTIAMSEVFVLPRDTTVTASAFQEDSINHTIYARITGLTVKRSSDKTLLYIYINGPSLNSACGTTEVFFRVPRQANINADTCCTPDVAPLEFAAIFNPLTISWDGATPCSYCHDLTVHATPSSVTPSDPCHSLAFELSLSSTTNRHYTEGTLIVDIAHSGTIELDDTHSEGVGTIATFEEEEISPTVLRVTVTVIPDALSSSILVSAPVSPSILFLRTIAYLEFTADTACINSVYFRDAIMQEKDSTDMCVPIYTSTDIREESVTDDICLASVGVTTKTYNGLGVEGVTCELTAPGSPPCTQTGITSNSGSAAFCPCPVNVTIDQVLTPTLDENYINGVSTFDLVLISKHILGISPLTNPYQFIAADANNSSSVTTFDVNELKKLVLGVIDNLPANTSWRFVDQDYTFPNNANPWEGTFPEAITFKGSAPHADFYAIKIGDINNNAVTSNFLQAEDRQQNTLSLGYAITGGKRGQVVEIPVFTQQTADLAAWQMALQYNPAVLKIKGIRWTTVAQTTIDQDEGWHIPVPGQLRLLWMDRMGAAVHLEANAPLAYIQAELLNDQRDLTGILSLGQIEKNIASEGYPAQGTPASFSLAPISDYHAPAIAAPVVVTRPVWTAKVYPNPTQGQFRIEVGLPEGGSGTITLYDALGRSCAAKSCMFIPGLNVITSTQLPALSPGQYMLRVETPLGRQTMRLMVHDK